MRKNPKPSNKDKTLTPNVVLLGDCLEIMGSMEKESVDLIYMDPPFNTGRRQVLGEMSYEDSWPDMTTFIGQFLRPRVMVAWQLLKPTGSIMVHVDFRSSHHVRFLLDQVFGEENFINHIVWSYGLGGSSRRRFARKHDDIMFYGKGPDYYFEPVMILAKAKRVGMKKMTDVIDYTMSNSHPERVGYPTQKPLALLNPLIQSACPPNGIVLDPVCGSGTTLVSAALNGRRWIGIDCNPDAVEVSKNRLKA